MISESFFNKRYKSLRSKKKNEKKLIKTFLIRKIQIKEKSSTYFVCIDRTINGIQLNNVTDIIYSINLYIIIVKI